MIAYDILIKQPEQTLFAEIPEQNIRIGTFFDKKPAVIKRAKYIQKILGRQVIVTVEKIRLVTK